MKGATLGEGLEMGCEGTYGQTATMQHTRGDPRIDTQRALHGAGWGTIHTERQRNTKAIYPRKRVTWKWATKKGFTRGEA